jgi:hypothetical protein
MRRIILLMTFAMWSALPLLFLVGLMIAWFGEVNALLLPNASDVRIDRPSLVHQQITYQLPPNPTLADLSAQLVQDGWIYDVPGERALQRDQMDNDVLVLFWRHGWLGLVSEVVTVRPGAHDQRLVDIQLIRCFTIYAWTHCL